MAITHTLATRNRLAEQVATDVDAGPAPGQLVIMTAADAEVATLTLSDPAYEAASGGTIVASPITSDTDTTGGIPALFKVVDSIGNEVYRGDVTATGGGGDLELSSLNEIGNGDTLSISYLAYTAPL